MGQETKNERSDKERVLSADRDMQKKLLSAKEEILELKQHIGNESVASPVGSPVGLAIPITEDHLFELRSKSQVLDFWELELMRNSIKENSVNVSISELTEVQREGETLRKENEALETRNAL